MNSPDSTARVSPSLQRMLCLGLLAIVLAVTAWIYWSGVTGPELLDDRSSVMVIKGLEESPERAMDYIFGDSSGTFGRSVSMATFVLEELYLDQGISGSKKVNICLHLLIGALVVWLLWLLFRYHGVRGYRPLALVLGAAWLLHPLFVSTVLYAVQRMAMLSTLFIVTGMIAYVYWRLALDAGRRGILPLLGVGASFVLGILSKENALVLIPSLLLLEALWFECRRGPQGEVIPWLRNGTLGLIGAGAVAVVALLVVFWDYLAQRMLGRPFTLEERLMTEGRIVWDYLAQLFWPQVERMGLYHDDVVISTSFSEPATTLYAALAWLALLLTSVALLRWRTGRWFALAVGLFLVGHSLESTVWSLELYFEHRNYAPAVAVMLLVGVAYAAAVARWPETAAPMLAGLAAAVILLAGLTSSQAQVWSKRSTLVLNHINGHPDSPRANIDMAVELATVGEAEAAHRYSLRAYEKSSNERVGDYEIRDLALSCMAKKPVPAEVIDRFAARDTERPLSSVTTLLTLVRMVQDDKCPQLDTLRLADRFKVLYLDDPDIWKGKPNIYANLAVLENVLGRYDYAYDYTERFLEMEPWNKRGMLMKLHFATALQREDAVQQVVGALRALDEQGRLTVAEQQNLALYLER